VAFVEEENRLIPNRLLRNLSAVSAACLGKDSQGSRNSLEERRESETVKRPRYER